MEKLTVKNFLTIEEAELEVGRMTVIIGPQASGKSVLAKLVFFFRDFWRVDFFSAVDDAAENPETKQDLSYYFESAFKNLFPQYGWENQPFSVEYTIKSVKISIHNQITNSSNELTINYSEQVRSLYESAVNITVSESQSEEFSAVRLMLAPMQEIHLTIAFWGLSLETILIPASRSFFALLQSNVFSLLERDFSIDVLLQRFGAKYERAKRVFLNNLFVRGAKPSSMLPVIIKEVEALVGGRYNREGGNEWIETGSSRVKLVHASSGQQESLPMLLLLLQALKLNTPKQFIIEEPETHLFPSSQKRLINVLSVLYDEGSDFLLTTHSPYILTALNDSVLAADVLEKHPEDAKQVQEILGAARPIRYENVRAYTLENGRLTSIMNEESRLIGTNVIDAVSDDFQEIFNRLLDLKYADDSTN